MKLSLAIHSYVTLKRSLGAVFCAEMRILKGFERFCGDVPIETILPETCHRFSRGSGPPTRWWERKHYTLRDFFLFLVARGHLPLSPFVEKAPRIRHSFEPHIYSREEVERLLKATSIFQNQDGALQPHTLRTLLLTLYAAGLRPSEGLRLRCCDVNLSERVLSIWDTKFFKSRLVPIGVSLNRALAAYDVIRQKDPLPESDQSAFFASPKGESLSLRQLETGFTKLRKHTGIEHPPGARWQPRLHDLRHTFAVHRLIGWYREGVDVQACLPLLSTYLGHVNLTGTKTYLTMTPELLAEASKRFEKYVSAYPQQQNHEND